MGKLLHEHVMPRLYPVTVAFSPWTGLMAEWGQVSPRGRDEEGRKRWDVCGEKRVGREGGRGRAPGRKEGHSAGFLRAKDEGGGQNG